LFFQLSLAKRKKEKAFNSLSINKELKKKTKGQKYSSKRKKRKIE